MANRLWYGDRSTTDDEPGYRLGTHHRRVQTFPAPRSKERELPGPMMDDQSETIAFLNEGAGTGLSVETVSTHISIVFLVGERALKLKRAVHLPYVDFSTPERRLAACDAELRLNRRTAPGLYRRVRRITREGGGRLAACGSIFSE